MGFLDNLLKPKDGDDGKKSGGIPNPFARPQTFHGQGKSLGGSKPGIVIPISLPNPGPLGVRVERRPNSEGTAIVNEIVAGSQADAAGMKRGDILCFAGSNGQEEMMYDMFLELAKSEQRPLQLEIRRIETKSTKPVAAVKKSAEADHRRQAVIAAAEAREKAHKAKTKPIKTVTKTTLAREKQLQQEAAAAANSTTSQQIEPQSEEAKRAAAAAKQSEAQLAQQLGYNPYEPSRATAGQARNATTAVTHGSISAAGGADSNSLPPVAPPRDVMESTGEEHELPIEVEEAFATMLSANAVDKVQSTCGIMKTLLLNATTKGQAPGEDSAKFRKVRLANAKIKAALVDVEGAMEIMMATGFILQEQEGESVLIFPADFPGPDWLPAALRQLESNSVGK